MLNDARGFTLIELIFIISFIGLLIPIIGNFYINSSDFVSSAFERMNSYQRAELAAEEMANYLKSAVSTDSLGKIDINGGEIRFESRRYDGNKNIQLKGESTESENNIIVTLKYGDKSEKIILSDIKSLEILEINDREQIFQININLNNEQLRKVVYAKNL
jgi:type II secretory pathway pseudopilin PulG